LIFTFAYGVCRFMLEMLRADDERGWIPPSLPEHILLPLALILFAVGYIVGPSKMIENPTIRTATRALAFVPAVIVFFVLKPESFGTSVTVQLSTSQAVALSTGVAACFAFNVYPQPALADLAAAMTIALPPELTSGEATGEKAVSKVADEDDDEAQEAKPKKKASEDGDAAPKKKKRKKAKKPASTEEVATQTDAGTAEASKKSSDEDVETSS